MMTMKVKDLSMVRFATFATRWLPDPRTHVRNAGGRAEAVSAAKTVWIVRVITVDTFPSNLNSFDCSYRAQPLLNYFIRD